MIALDSNILVYSLQAEESEKHQRALELLALAAITEMIVPIQVLGEFLNVCRRKLGATPQEAVNHVSDFRETFACPATTISDLADAAHLADRYCLQYFDALIVSIAERSGATVLLSEDMQDGQEIMGLLILNPFNPANAARIEVAIGK